MSQETVIYRTNLHWSIYCKAIFLFGVAIVAFIVAASPLCHPALVSASHPALRHASRAALNHVGSISILGKICNGIGLVFVIFGFISFLKNWTKSKSSEFAVTNKRVMIKVGSLQRHTLEVLLQRVEGVGVDQGVLGRMLGYGSISVSGTGGTKEGFDHIDNPLEFRRQVLSAADSSTSKIQ
jgi:uncharacterized membrane protein YdbT with pleckstrin-like domain